MTTTMRDVSNSLSRWLTRAWWLCGPWVALAAGSHVYEQTITRRSTGANASPYGAFDHEDLRGPLLKLCEAGSVVWLVGAAALLSYLMLRRSSLPHRLVGQALISLFALALPTIPGFLWDQVLVRTVGPGNAAGAILADVAGHGDTAQLRSLLARGIGVDSPDYSPFGLRASSRPTALMKAAEMGRQDAAEVLLAHHADPNRGNDYGETALMRAVAARNLTIVRLLLAHGANPCAVTHYNKLAPPTQPPGFRSKEFSVQDVALYIADREILAALPPCSDAGEQQ